jgi:hypothetical protein
MPWAGIDPPKDQAAFDVDHFRRQRFWWLERRRKDLHCVVACSVEDEEQHTVTIGLDERRDSLVVNVHDLGLEAHSAICIIGRSRAKRIGVPR